MASWQQKMVVFLNQMAEVWTLLVMQIHSRKGATHITSWGKFWLSALGCYSWDGNNPTPPEFWLLPYAGWTGIGWIHPGRYWCHCRQVLPADTPQNRWPPASTNAEGSQQTLSHGSNQ